MQSARIASSPCYCLSHRRSCAQALPTFTKVALLVFVHECEQTVEKE